MIRLTGELEADWDWSRSFEGMIEASFDRLSGTFVGRNIFLYICYNLLNQLIDKKIYKMRRRNAKSKPAASL